MRRLAAVGLLVMASIAGGVVLDVVTAAPAAAHATLVATTPAENARLEAPPAEVTLEFTEGVDVGAGYARVLGPGGERVDTGTAGEDGGVVTIPLRSGLPDASYVVTYRVVSEDAHPISGAYAFVVGDAELVAATSAADGDAVDPGVAAALPVARWLGFAGIALAIGVPVFVLVCWPAGWRVAVLRRLTVAGVAAVVLGAAAAFLVQGPYAAGAGLGAVFDPSLLAATAGSGFGSVVLLRLLCGLLLAAVLAVGWRRETRPSAAWIVAGAVPAVVLVVTTAAVGHPVAGPWPGLAVTSAAVHVAAMAVWLGGLVALLTGLVRPGVSAAELGGALPRYSQLAFGSVVALVVTGVVQSVREVGSPSALVATTYGWLLLAKLAVVLAVLAAAGVSRVWVQQQFGVHRRPRGRRRVTAHAFAAGAGGAGDVGAGVGAAGRARGAAPADAAVDDIRPFRRSVLVEVLLAAVVLAVTAVLVGTPPARSSVTEPVDVTLPLQGDTGTAAARSVQISVVPAGTGPNSLHVFVYDEAGQLTDPQDVSVTLTEAGQEIGPLDVELLPAGPGHYIADGMSIPTPGTWTLTVAVRLDEFTATTASTTFPVR